MTLDIITLGEAMLRFSPPSPQVLEQATQFDVRGAGAEANVAVTASRMGLKTGWISRLPNHALGRLIANSARAHGVDLSRMVWADEGRVGTYYLELENAPRPANVIYDRADSAITKLTPEMVDWDYVRDTRIFHTTGITPALSASLRDVVEQGLTVARESGATTSLDINYRAKLWSPDLACAALTPLFTKLDILRSGLDEAEIVLGIKGTAEDVVCEMNKRYGVKITVITDGARQVAAYDGSKLYTQTPYPVDIVDPIGAGDAFTVGFLMGYLEGDLQKGLDYGVALGGLTHTYAGDVPWCTRADVEALVHKKQTPYR